jgi:hypothetical protein
MFDTPSSADRSVVVLMPKEQIERVPSQSMVRIKSVTDKRSYLGIVIEGPFAEPDGLRADAPVLVSVTVRGGLLMPKYHGRVHVDLIAEELDDGGLVPPRRRPLPNSPVFLLNDDEMATVLRTGGDIRLGVIDGHENIEVKVPRSKSVLPRHIGILGTTGGGKSTTVSGMLSQLQEAGAACVVIDTEGEYTAIDKETDDQNMLKALTRRGLAPRGVADTHVYHLVGRDTRNPNHPSVHSFTMRFSDMSPYAVMEVLDLTDAQEERFLKAYDATKRVMDALKIYPVTQDEKAEAITIDEQENGYPKMTLDCLYDIVQLVASRFQGEENTPYLATSALRKNAKKADSAINWGSMPKNWTSWRALQGRLGRIKRLKVFDNSAAESIDYADLLAPGRVSIIDLSDTDSPYVNNLVIAQILRGVQRAQDSAYEEAVKQGKAPTPVMVFVEEAHEFLSAQRIKHMPVLFQQVARISRRGRKRWLGLAFITQLPQHLPDEVLGLINNWVLHKISDSNVIGRLRKSIGGIDEGLWSYLPSLAPGQAILSFTSLARPLMCTIDPTPCKLLLVD